MSLSAASFQYICDLARREAALEFGAGKEYLVASRLEPIAKAKQCKDIDGLVRQLQKAPALALRREIAEALTTNETHFFRDMHPFEALRTQVLPRLIERQRRQRSLRILSAACSSGQEPYTVAMILWEHFPEVAGWNVEIVATDFNEKVLAKARAGSYRQFEVSRGLPTSYLVKYMKRRGACWQVDERLRQTVTFQQQNLTVPWTVSGSFSLILLRNVLIYFSSQTKEFVLKQAASMLNRGGVVLLGATENTMGLKVPLKRQEVASSSFVYQRQEDL